MCGSFLIQDNDRILVGQCNISHPVDTSGGVQDITPNSEPSDSLGEILNPRVNLIYTKSKEKAPEEPLESKIRRMSQ